MSYTAFFDNHSNYSIFQNFPEILFQQFQISRCGISSLKNPDTSELKIWQCENELNPKGLWGAGTELGRRNTPPINPEWQREQ